MRRTRLERLQRIPLVRGLTRWMEVTEIVLVARGWHGALMRTASLAIPIAAYTVVLSAYWPRNLLLASYYSSILIAIAAVPALTVCISRRGWVASLSGLALTLSLFGLPLVALWSHLAIHPNTVGELLPWSDASNYYYDARVLIDGHLLGWSTRRPLFVGVLATLLKLTQGNLQMALAILVALSAVACFLLAREVRISHGAPAAVAALMILFFFYRADGGAGTTLTENLGFSLGAASLAVLYRAARERRPGRFGLGLALLALALMARAGAFFVLPALALAGARALGATRKQATAILAGTAAAVALAVVWNLAVARALTAPTTPHSAMSNFSETLYGLVVGGKGRRQVPIDHPGATEGAQVYALALNAFLDRPSGLVTGTLRMWREYLPNRRHHAFAFVLDNMAPRLVTAACYLLCALGLLRSIRSRQRPEYMLMAAGAAGHFASIPFAPPIDGGSRIYAATIPFLALLVGIGTMEALRIFRVVTARFRSASLVRGAPRGPGNGGEVWSEAATLLGIVLAGAATLGPLWVYWSSRSPAFAERSCPAGQRPVYVRWTSGSSLRVVENDSGQTDRVRVPQVRPAHLYTSVDVTELRGDRAWFVAGRTIMNTHDLKTGAPVWLVAPTILLPTPPAVLGICGQDSANPEARAYGVFHARSVQPADESASLRR